MRRAIAIPLLVIVLFAAGGAAAAVAAYDHARRDLIAPGVRIAGVPVGRLHADAARARVAAALRGPLSEPVVVTARGRHFTLSPARTHARVDVDALVADAVTRSRDGSIFTRTFDALRGQPMHTDLPARVQFSHAAVRHLTHRVAATLDRPAIDATLEPTATGIVQTASHNGAHVATRRLRHALLAALVRPDGARTVHARVRTVVPKTTSSDLVHKYPSYIIIDRAAFTLRFYRDLQLARTYPIAVGRAGLETPAGLYDVQWKQTNPSWYVPNSAWAGDLAGKVIPPGPDDPIKARWMAFNGGAGIHGIDPSEYGSIGHNASHGCVRMRIPDVIELYDQTPVHTPVFVA